jgi:hypothetical protein
MNTYLKISTGLWQLIKLVLILFHLLIGFFYIQHFHTSLLSNEFEHINGVTRIVIPDTFLYKEIIDLDDFYVSTVLSGVKNAVGPALLWVIGGLDWYGVFYINLILLIFIVQYMEGLVEQCSINRSKARFAIITFLLLPVIFYYSIGALKELPTMLILLGFLYHTNAKQYKLTFIFVVMAFLFRYQLAVILLMFSISLRFGKSQLKFTLILLIVLSAVFPILTSLDLTASSTTELYRVAIGVPGSLGEIVEIVRDKIFILSTVAVLIRVFQSLLEPFVSLIGTVPFYEDESFSVFAFSHVMSLIVMIPFIKKFAIRLSTSFNSRNPPSLDAQKIYSFVLILLVTIGGFSFVHHRYLVPIFPLLIIASLMPQTKFAFEPSNSILR